MDLKIKKLKLVEQLFDKAVLGVKLSTIRKPGKLKKGEKFKFTCGWLETGPFIVESMKTIRLKDNWEVTVKDYIPQFRRTRWIKLDGLEKQIMAKIEGFEMAGDMFRFWDDYRKENKLSGSLEMEVAYFHKSENN